MSSGHTGDPVSAVSGKVTAHSHESEAPMGCQLLFEEITGVIRQTAFETQILNYLKATGFLVGTLINFGATRLQFRRFVYEAARSRAGSPVGAPE